MHNLNQQHAINNQKIQVFLEDCSPLLEIKVRRGLEELKKSFHLLGIDDSLDFLLDCFCDYFISKGIVTVEYCDYEID